MDKKALQEQFEQTKTYDLCKSWQIDFDEKAEIYYSINSAYHNDVIALNAAWSMFQEQQAKVEELQKRVDSQQKLLGIYRVLAEDQLDNCADNLIARINELEQALKGE